MAQLHAVVLGNGVSKRGGHDGHDGHGILRHGALFDAARADVVQEQRAHLVAGHQLVAAVRAAHGNAHAVGVGVGGEHEIGTRLLGELKAVLEGLEDLGVGIGSGGEVAVGVLLLRHDGDVGDAHVAEDLGHGDKAGAVERGVDQLQAGGAGQTRAHLAGFNGFIEGLLAVVADELDETFFHALGKGDALGAGEDVGLLDLVIDDGGGVIGHLAASSGWRRTGRARA